MAVAYSDVAARTVHRSLFECLPTPSVTHAPLLSMWQYCEPEMTLQNVVYGADGGDGGGEGGAGDVMGGGGDGDGGGGGGIAGGTAVGVREAQMMKPPLTME